MFFHYHVFPLSYVFPLSLKIVKYRITIGSKENNQLKVLETLAIEMKVYLTEIETSYNLEILKMLLL